MHVHKGQHRRGPEGNSPCCITTPMTSLGDGSIQPQPRLAGRRRVRGPLMTEMSLCGAWLYILFTNNISEVYKENQQVIFQKKKK